MHDRVDAAFEQHLIDAMRLVQIAYDQPIGRNGPAMAEREIVVDPDIVPAFQEKLDGVGTDVARAAK